MSGPVTAFLDANASTQQGTTEMTAAAHIRPATPPRIATLDNAKSYATEANLRAALARTGLDQWDGAETIVITRTAGDRWTAIFILDRHQGGYIAAAAQHGFYSF